MTRRILVFCLAVVVVCSLVVTGQAMSIAISNSSFENPVQGDGGYGVAGVPGWTTAGGPAIGTQDADNGKYLGTSPNTPGTLPAPAAGLQFAYVEMGGTSNLTGTLSQTLGSYGITSNTQYTLDVAVGQPLDATYSSYSVQLMVNGNPVGTAVDPPAVHGAFVGATVSFSTGANDPLAGDNFTIVLTGTSVGNATGAHAQVNFDNVQLFANTVPEPSTISLAVVGLAGMLLVRRRKVD